MRNKSGFTLLEIIIAVTILAFISIFTAQAIHNGLKDKVKIQKRIENDSTIRDALSVVANDIRYAFNYRDINIELFNMAQEERKKRATAKKPTTPTTPTAGSTTGTTPPTTPTTTPTATTPTNTDPKKFELKKEVVLTHFIGQKDSLNFSAKSYSRSIENSPYSDQGEVGYFLKDCRSRVDKKLRSQCLWRRVSPFIDDKIEEGGEESVLLENVTKLEFRFLGPGSEDEWRDDWMSDVRGDATTKNNFPYAVEITLEVQNKNVQKSKLLSMTAVAPIAFPNNQDEKKEEEKSEKNTTGQ